MNAPEYFERWFRAENQPIRPLSQQQAEARHFAGEPYVALLHANNEKPVIDIAGDWVSVMFFDLGRRLLLKYDFKKMESGRLFLSSAFYMEYEGEITRPHTTITFSFKPDGSIIVERRNMISGVLEEMDSSGDPAPNRDAYPEVGDYRSLCRLNRTPIL